MSPILVLIATAALGIEVGWEPLDEGGYEYSIQLEPQLLDVLKKETDEITSEVPPHINVRRYRIFVGTGKLIRVDGPDRQAAEPPPADPRPAETADRPEASPPLETDSADPIPDAQDERRTAARHETAPARGHVPEERAGGPEAPAPLPDAVGHAEPLSSVSFDAQASAHHAKESQHNSPPRQAAPKDEARPWTAMLIATVLLSCSLGANIYLGWIAWDARSRYRATLAQFRAQPAS